MANAIRMLTVDAVEKAKSGHPGAPMGMAEIAEVLWSRHLKHNPANPQWMDRDRFVLSNGHGSMLLYALLHLTGYDLPMKELQAFRQLHSKTPGHPEVDVTPGVETTTGPLGQGLANAVGMALAEKLLATEFNRCEDGQNHHVVDHFTYVFLGDGCLMEGISHEACSFAGTMRLSKLIVLYDDNGISIDGHVEGWFTDDTPKRFESYGWNVIANVDGHDADAVNAAIAQARAQAYDPKGRPTMICCDTVIGQGSPTKAGTHDVHGAALGAAEVQATRDALGWTHAPFVIPPDIAAAWDARERGMKAERSWREAAGPSSQNSPRLSASTRPALRCLQALCPPVSGPRQYSGGGDRRRWNRPADISARWSCYRWHRTTRPGIDGNRSGSQSNAAVRFHSHRRPPCRSHRGTRRSLSPPRRRHLYRELPGSA